MPDILTNLHLMRPAWLWALLALPLLAWWWRARRRRANAWRDAVDPHLLAHLLEARSGARGRMALALGLLGVVLAVLALSGPSWRQVAQPLWQTRAPLVIALDLSSATTASDLPPSRLLQARAKLDTLLRERAGGQVGLVAYAGDAFTVAPLTDDAANVALFLDALEPAIMPVDGQRADRAIDWSLTLLRQAGFDRGDILLLTDYADVDARNAAAAAAAAGYRVSALGLGSDTGAVYRNDVGQIAHARLDAASLRALARAGGGAYAALTPGSSDLQALRVLDPQRTAGTATDDERGRHWQDQGYWLLLPLLLLGLLAFRRGGAVAALLLCLCLPWQPARAAQMPGFDDLWQRPDQQAHARMQLGTQAYRAGEFDAAAQAWRGLDSAVGHYNRGNALARAGQYRDAIDAYDAALLEQPGMADAIANKAAVEALLKRQPPPGGQNRQPPNQQNRSDGQGGQDPQDGQSQGGDRQDGSSARPSSQDDNPQPPQSGESEPADTPEPADAQPQDAQAQERADVAQRERMQRALEQAQQAQEKREAQGAAQARPDPDETPAERERRLANQAWLQRVPDDPGGLLRRKFALEYQRRQMQGEDR